MIDLEGCYCADGCGQPATTERAEAMIDGVMIVDLICEQCALESLTIDDEATV
jgi:hypothetical protein